MSVAVVQDPVQIAPLENGLDTCTLPDEVIVVCPKCKTLETLWFSSGFLIPTRKFRQSGNQVYHDCGSMEPCNFYHF